MRVQCLKSFGMKLASMKVVYNVHYLLCKHCEVPFARDKFKNVSVFSVSSATAVRVGATC